MSVMPRYLTSPKFLLWPALLFVILFLSACEKQPAALPVINPSETNPQHLSQRDFSQRITLINFWAEWCKPCIKEIPELNQFQKEHLDKALVIGINFDQLKGNKLKSAQEKAGIQFTVLEEIPSHYFELPSVEVLPTTLVYNVKGKLIHTLLGPQTNDTLLTAIQNSASPLKDK